MEPHYIDAVIIVLGWAGFVAAQRVWTQELRRRVGVLEAAREQLQHDYVPRSECELALRNIERQTAETHDLLKAFIHSGGDFGVAIRALEAAAVTVEPWLSDYVAHICPQFEGTVPWMYLDTDGLVTVADGNMLPTAAAACALPFRAPGDGRPATAEEIAEDFARVHDMKAGCRTSFYRSSTSPFLAPADIDALLLTRCTEFVAQLRAIFPRFDAWPDPAKQAVLDMAFNCGIGRSAGPLRPHASGLHQFGHLIAALSQTPPDFKTAAANCRRYGPGPNRNLWTADQFLRAAGEPA